ncbi:UDP-glucose 4-epimerase GalE [Candidatus Saccharibacteria bacterium]|nr:MAG: UDP-glucose 4-epimerase GalE [Candidatus Saccharibacteria bacterium]
MRVLVTGGAGYIGSHTVVELLQAGHEPVVVDNLVNSSAESLNRIKQITDKPVVFYEVDLCDKPALEKVFAKESFDAVIHFAGLKAVGESVAKPLEYYHNNIDSTLTLCEVMQSHAVKKLIFSSSATVYGNPETLPVKETSQVGVGVTNPYGQTKYMIEQILQDLVVSDSAWGITLLRYFNPIGAHPSGLIGEDPNGTPNNLVPFISQVAVGRRKTLNIYGDDYDTPDGTGVRDYIHVVDLAKGHVAALGHIGEPQACNVYNLGSGTGASVLAIVKLFESVCGKAIPYEIVARRPGDVPVLYADCSKADDELGWKTELSLEAACRDTWNWQSKNPNGYEEKTV